MLKVKITINTEMAASDHSLLFGTIPAYMLEKLKRTMQISDRIIICSSIFIPGTFQILKREHSNTHYLIMIFNLFMKNTVT